LREVLIPVVSKQQLDKKYLLEAAGGADTAFLLHVIDTSSPKPASDFAEEMREFEELLEKAKEDLGRAGVRAVVVEEWGDLVEKIKVVSRREEVEEVVLPKKLRLEVTGIKVKYV